MEALRSGLRDLGYVGGKNFIIEFRWAERADQTFELATELVRMNVDVIFAPASTQVEPARRASKAIPIVFAQHADPVGLGDVASLSRPGGNITGMSMLLILNRDLGHRVGDFEGNIAQRGSDRRPLESHDAFAPNRRKGG